MRTKITFNFNGKQKSIIAKHSLPMDRCLMAIWIMTNYVLAEYPNSNREKAEELIEQGKESIFLCKNTSHPNHKGKITKARFDNLYI